MIRYALKCAAGHEFEGWFRNSAAFEAQLSESEIACPSCGTSEVSKALMAPAVASGAAEHGGGPSEAHRTRPPQMLNPDPRAQALMEAIRQLRRHVQENSDYVGARFPEEARRIHYEEAEHRMIHGEASLEEARALLEEGIEIQPLPGLPDEQN